MQFVLYQVFCKMFYNTFCEIWFMKIDDDLADCYSRDFWMHIVLRNTARELNNKRTKKRNKKSVRIEQFLRVACNQKKAYKALERWRRDYVTRNEIQCISVSRVTDESWHIVYLALFCRTDHCFHSLLAYKILSQLSFAMTVVDMSCINFYQSSSASSSCFSLKSSILSNTDEKCTTILKHDWWNKSFTTNQKIEPLFQTQIAEDIRVENEDIFETQRHKKFI